MTRSRSLVLCLLAMLPALAMAVPIPARADDSRKVTIRCDKNKTITDALAQHQGGPDRRGRRDVLRTRHVHRSGRDPRGWRARCGHPGDGFQGGHPHGHRRSLRAGWTEREWRPQRHRCHRRQPGSALRNCTVRGAGSGIVSGIGILFRQGASGSVDSCNSSGNGGRHLPRRLHRCDHQQHDQR